MISCGKKLGTVAAVAGTLVSATPAMLGQSHILASELNTRPGGQLWLNATSRWHFKNFDLSFGSAEIPPVPSTQGSSYFRLVPICTLIEIVESFSQLLFVLNIRIIKNQSIVVSGLALKISNQCRLSKNLYVLSKKSMTKL
ncbi:hypothetical protein BpHYR1_013596 [Brachionus plicatilis]|uniref:Uncharacterized protein n=1 Tax=Brachionus plicatilis TaxID=10195 RepID=A0A3M7R0Y3_BRAPC|nr:hypothetical protein BpHYR1_013596 [Brachionus plicatilis]